MAAAEFNCPHCQGVYQVDATFGGMQVSCPHCQQIATLPESLSPVPSPMSTSNVSQFNCPQCHGEFRVGASMAGQQVACPHCRSVVTVSTDVAAVKPSTPAPTVPQKPVAPQGASSPRSPAPVSKPSAASTSPLAEAMYPPGFGPAGKIETPAPKPSQPQTQPASPTPTPIPKTPKSSGPSAASSYSYPPGFGPAPLAEVASPAEQPKPDMPRAVPVMPAKPQATAAEANPWTAPTVAMPAPVPVPTPTSKPTPINSNVDELLPPGITPSSSHEAMPTDLDGFLPASLTVERSVTQPGEGSFVLPSEDGGYVTVRESVKTVEFHGEEVELHRLTPEEKQRKRFFKNVVMAVLGILFLSAVTIILVFLT